MFSGFVQDQIAVIGLRLPQSGVKLQPNDYTGFGSQAERPHQLDPKQSEHALGSRFPGRTNASAERHQHPSQQRRPAGAGRLSPLISIFGNPGLKNEVVRTVEAGYRTQLTNRFLVGRHGLLQPLQ